MQYRMYLWLAYALALGLLLYRKRLLVMRVVVFSLALSLTEAFVDRHYQASIEQRVEQMDTYTAPEGVLIEAKYDTFHILKTREWLAAASFGMLALGVGFSGYRNIGE